MAERIDVREAHRMTDSGQALLVCAYEDDAKCSRLRLQGALTMGELQPRLRTLGKDQPIIFYCA